ncbi:MAG: hypothetical protein E4H05_00315 [Acidimicrobiales bacterium]|nr:MAG: hypothetical protein E4H05_00315 [Acidimicrobiales bacterium]
MNDELRAQLERLDPMHPGVPVESATTPSSTARMENIMNTPLIDQKDSGSSPTPELSSMTIHRRRNRLLLGVAAAAIVAIGGAVIVGNNSGDDSTEMTAGPPIELSLGDSNVMSSCIVFDVALLADMSPAFAGTAMSVEGETVTLTVDRWYTGGDAATVILLGTAGSPALIDGFEFEVGQQYLITAAGGNVNFCGYSGPATPELTAAFDAAFPS